jgi:ribosomal protein S18 acetylase RimI-like enzyme
MLDLHRCSSTLTATSVIEIKQYSASLRQEAVKVLADAFVANPLHIAAFGAGRVDRNRLFFRIGLEHMFTGAAFVAVAGGKVRGYIHFNASPRCLPPAEAIPAFAAERLQPVKEAVPRLIEWFSRWSRLDPEEPHAHLGPIGVAPEYQGQGIGAALMNRYVEHLEREGIEGYLETDRAGNVEFYKKFGFAVMREEKLIGVDTWYMRRPRG